MSLIDYKDEVVSNMEYMWGCTEKKARAAVKRNSDYIKEEWKQMSAWDMAAWIGNPNPLSNKTAIIGLGALVGIGAIVYAVTKKPEAPGQLNAPPASRDPHLRTFGGYPYHR